MSEVLDDRERALSNFFKARIEECGTDAAVFLGVRDISMIKREDEDSAIALAEAAISMTEMAGKLEGLAFLADQQEGTRTIVLTDIREGTTLSRCVARFKELVEGEAFPSSIRDDMLEQFELLNKEYVFES